MEKKKTKLTISGSPKKSFKNFSSSKPQEKNLSSPNKGFNKPSGNSSFRKSSGSGFKPSGNNFGRSTGFKSSGNNFGKSTGFKSSGNNFGKSTGFESKFPVSSPSTLNDFEKRKLAEQRATKRLKGDNDKDKKSKLDTIKKRDTKLTVSRALSDEIETRERSLALSLIHI